MAHSSTLLQACLVLTFLVGVIAVPPQTREKDVQLPNFSAGATAPLPSALDTYKDTLAPAVLRDALSSRDVQEGIALAYQATSSATNASFELDFCAKFNVSVSSLSLSGSTLPLLLPPCFYDFAASLTSVTFHKVIVMGSTGSSDDPLIRLVQSTSNSIETIRMTNSFLLHSSGATYTSPQWSNFFGLTLKLGVLIITGTPIQGGLPDQLPGTLKQIDLVGLGLTGAIPPSLFAGYASSTEKVLHFHFSANLLTGTIPPDLFSDLPLATITQLSFSLAMNRLEGEIPATLLQVPMPVMAALTLDLSHSGLSGVLDHLFAYTAFPSLNYLALTLSGNQFTGSIPESWFALDMATGTANSLVLAVAGNLLKGPLPSRILHKGYTVLRLDLSDNAINGAIPSDFLTYSTLTPAVTTHATVEVLLYENLLSGDLPSALFSTVNWTSLSAFSLRLNNNQFTGGLPSNLLSNAYTPTLTSLSLSFASNRLMNGTIPSTFLSSLNADASNIPTGSSSPETPLTFLLSLEYTNLTGTLAIPDLSLRLVNPPLRMTITGLETNLQSLTIHPNAASSLFALVLTNSSQVHGSIPSSIFGPSSIMNSFFVGGTLLAGPMPDMGALMPPALSTLDLSRTAIDFCSTPRTAWNTSFLSTCYLYSTSASQCRSLYPSSCIISESAIVAPAPVTIPTAPSPCPAATRPGPSFFCIDGHWISTVTVNTTVFTIPGGSTEVIVTNITSSSIVIQGVGSTLIITGCASNLSTVTVELTQEELKQLGSKAVQQLILVNSSYASCVDLSSVTIDVKVTGSGCRKAKADKIATANSLAAAFSVSSSACNLWWIILASVLCALVLIGVIVGVVVNIHLRKNKFDPLRRRNTTD